MTIIISLSFTAEKWHNVPVKKLYNTSSNKAAQKRSDTHAFRTMQDNLFFPQAILLLHWLYSRFDLVRFFSFLIYTPSVELLGRGISPSQGRYLHTQSKRTHKHACLEWDLKPRSQCLRAKTVHALDRAATVICCVTYIRRSVITNS
jgi:hypothetical protein